MSIDSDNQPKEDSDELRSDPDTLPDLDLYPLLEPIYASDGERAEAMEGLLRVTPASFPSRRYSKE